MLAQGKPYSISEITQRIKGLLEDSLPTIWVEGEISNFTRHTSGHMYFSLKDEGAQLRCVMWKWQSTRLFFAPQNGMQVLAQGDVSVYERSGQYQFVVSQLQPVGMGALQLAFDQLKQRLAAEGLFDEAAKKPLPPFPEAVGVVTSPTGAALRDIAQIIGRRFPGVQLVLRPVSVQGEGAADQIAQAIREFNAYGRVDVLIVGRGGGSLEDLCAFNDEAVARAIAASQIPVVSAVGHEVDFTISDLAADVRAPTPSAAAEMVVRDRAELLELLAGLRQRLSSLAAKRLADARGRLDLLRPDLALRRVADRVQQRVQHMDDLAARLVRAFEHTLTAKTGLFQELAAALNTLSPLSTLQRGYSIVYRLPQRSVVRSSSVLNVHDDLEIAFASGKARCKVEHLE